MQPRYVVVDGSNIATEGRLVPSLAQLDEAVRCFQAEFPDVQIVVVVDATFGHRIDPSDRAAFDEAVAHGEVVSPPAGAIGRGDAFLLQVASKVEAQVLSNDSFQEFHGEHGWLFDSDRLIGGKPIPGIGWIFTLRNPVRGPKSRAATSGTRSSRSTSGGRKRAAGGSGGDLATGNDQEEAEELSLTDEEIRAEHLRRTQLLMDPSMPKPSVGDKKPQRRRPTARPIREGGDATETLPTPADSETPTHIGEPTKAPRATKATKAANAVKLVKATKTAKAVKAVKVLKATKTLKSAEVPEATTVAEPAKATRARKATKAAEPAKATRAPKTVEATQATTATKAAKATRATKTVKSTQATKAGDARAGSDPNRSDVIGEIDGDSGSAPLKPARRARGHRAAKAVEAVAPVNDPLTFLTFVTDHPVGAEIQGVVEEYTSHGAMIKVGEMHCYAPCSGLGDPAPGRARDVLKPDVAYRFRLVSLDAPRRSAELALVQPS